LNLPAAKYDKFSTIEWKPRRWPWVDPLKDVQANVVSVENGFKSRRAIISEAGGDIEDTFEEIAADNQLAESKGVELDADRSVEPESE
jgi:capsid protein